MAISGLLPGEDRKRSRSARNLAREFPRAKKKVSDSLNPGFELNSPAREAQSIPDSSCRLAVNNEIGRRYGTRLLKAATRTKIPEGVTSMVIFQQIMYGFFAILMLAAIGITIWFYKKQKENDR